MNRPDLGGLREGTGWKRAKKPLLAVLLLAAFLGVEYLMVGWLGIIDAVLYTVMFIIGAAAFPFFIAIGGEVLPFNVRIARVHILLGALAFNHHYLVDRGDHWEWCPGEAERVYIDGEWHDIDGGFENRSVLGWRPFGILRYKDDEAYTSLRVDTKAERQRGRPTKADGGAAISRGGYAEASPPAETGIDGTWVIDLKRLFASGVKKFGDVELVETAEEVIERGEVMPSSFENWRPFLETMAGIAFGVVVGYLMFFAA